MTSIVRTWLYVPAHHPDRAHKALVSGADAVVLDLEDSVPGERKDEARDAAIALLSDVPSDRPRIWVRVNPLSSAWGQADVAALSNVPMDGVRLPRSEDPTEVASLARSLGCPVQLLVETARGLLGARELAAAHRAVVGIALGEADLAADLRVAPEGLEWARGWIVAVARAAGLSSPVQSVYTDVADLEGLRATTAAGRQHGFFGRSVVHPRQIETIHEVYRPTHDDLSRAQDLITAYEKAREGGEAAALTPDGRFVDPAVVAEAQLTLELAALDRATSTELTPTEENR